MVSYIIIAVAFGAYVVGQIITDALTVDTLINGGTPRLNFVIVVAGYPQIRTTTT